MATACTSGSEGSAEEDTTTTNMTNVENVNGNLPDTSNSMNLGIDDTTGSTRGDTVPR